MYYGNYLVHFNKNHSSKNGQFINGDGDGDGQIDERHRYTKDNWSRFMGFQNSDGSLTQKGQHNIDSYKKKVKDDKLVESEAKKLLKSSKELSEFMDLDFDTIDGIIEQAWELDLNTDALEKAYNEYKNNDFVASHYGEQMAIRIKDL